MPELFPSVAFGWEGKVGAERVGGDGGQVPAFDGVVGSCSLLLPLFHPKYVLGHSGSFVPPCGHVEADIDDVCIIDDVAVVGQVVDDMSRDDLVVVSVGVLDLN